MKAVSILALGASLSFLEIEALKSKPLISTTTHSFFSSSSSKLRRLPNRPTSNLIQEAVTLSSKLQVHTFVGQIHQTRALTLDLTSQMLLQRINISTATSKWNMVVEIGLLAIGCQILTASVGQHYKMPNSVSCIRLPYLKALWASATRSLKAEMSLVGSHNTPTSQCC